MTKARVTEARGAPRCPSGQTGIAPVGLPADWPLLVDASLLELERVLIGSGRRVGKLVVPGNFFAQLPGAAVLPGLPG